MLERIAQLLNNPAQGIARDTSVRAGGTVFVKVGNKTINAIAVNDINGANVAVFWAESENRYYAVSPHTPVLISSETKELDRSAFKRIIEQQLIYIVVIDPPTRYGEDAENLGLTSGYFFLFALLYSQEDSEIINLSTINSLTVTVQRYLNGTLNQQDLTHWALVYANFTLQRLTFYSQNKVYIFGSPLTLSGSLAAIVDMLENETGQTLSALRDATRTFAGDSVKSYDYIIQDDVGGDRTETITVEEFSGNSYPSNLAMDYVALIFDFGRDSEYYRWEISNPNYPVDGLTIFGGSGHILVTSLFDNSITGAWTRNYTYSPIDTSLYPNYSYTRYDQNQGSGQVFIDNSTFSLTTNTGNIVTRVLQDFTVTNRESFTNSELVSVIDLDALTLGFGGFTQSASSSDEEILRVIVESSKDVDFFSVGIGGTQGYGMTELTLGLDVDWIFTKNFSHNFSISGNFTFDSLSIPLTYSWSTSIAYSDSVSFSAQSIQTPPILLEPVFPDVTDQFDIVHNAIHSFSFVIDAVFDYPKSTSASQPISKSFNLVKTFAASDSTVLYCKAAFSISAAYTSSYTSRLRVRNDGLISVVSFIYRQPLVKFAEFSRELYNPLDVVADNDSFTLDLFDLFFFEVQDEVQIAEWGLFTADGNLRDDACTLIHTLTVSSMSFSMKVAFFNGVGETELNTANSLHGTFSSPIITPTTISITSCKLYGTVGGAEPTILTSYTIARTITYEPTTITRNLTAGTSIGYVDLSAFVGVEFYVFDRDNSILYTATLATYTALNNSRSDLTFNIISQVELKSRAFLLSGNSFCLATKANLSASFCNIPEINTRLALKGESIFLSYLTDPPDVEEIQYVHKLQVSGQNLVYVEEIAANINAAVDNTAFRDYKQYVE